jgi:hypothetical protein
VCWLTSGSGSSFRRADGTFAGRGPRAVEAVGMVWLRDMISQTGVVDDKVDVPNHDSDFRAKLSGTWRASVDCSTRLRHRLNSLSDKSAAVIGTDKSAG